MENNAKTPPLIMFGLDTGDREAILRWAREGYLPTIASILERGCWGATGGPEMICEYGASLTLFSGISRTEHGYYYFRQLKPGTYELENLKPSDVVKGVPPFWSYFCDRSKKVFIADVPDIDPIPGIQGMQISNWGTHTHSPDPPSTEPAELVKEVLNLVGPRMMIPGMPDSDFQHDLQMYRRLLERLEKKGKLCITLLARDNFDLINITFSETDPASTQFWKYRPEARGNGTASGENELTHAIRNMYQAVDREVGALLAQLPKDANIIIYSLYGSQDEYPTSTLIDSFCRQLGYHVSLPPGQRQPSLLNLARQIIPQPLRLAISRFLPSSTQESLLANQLNAGTDWQKTTAFAIPSLFTSFVRVNLKGREPQGIVEPGAEYEAVLQRLEDDLKQLVDPHDGKPAVRRVARTVELFNCQPPLSLPDIFVEWKPGDRFMDRVTHPQTVLVQEKPQYCPDNQEKLSGFVAAAGPSIQGRGDIGHVSLLDLAPTFLSLIGEPIPEHIKGKPIEAIAGAPGEKK
ncbi:alkaline phosphatase family protein [Kamptonema formosum]|uniref:alkaline phosphatase family protein n=1 Tax=Kamptonema formosum TaxID=331992 RepID=UPI00034D6E4E|nr:alkaline phosphatase family protein [Oscillatoria sp. PCC 10802]